MRAFSYMIADSSQFGAPAVPAAPGMASKEYATELVELYWCSLLRDVAFSDYAASPVAIEAAQEPYRHRPAEARMSLMRSSD